MIRIAYGLCIRQFTLYISMHLNVFRSPLYVKLRILKRILHCITVKGVSLPEMSVQKLPSGHIEETKKRQKNIGENRIKIVQSVQMH